MSYPKRGRGRRNRLTYRESAVLSLMDKKETELLDQIESAWGIIANAYGGDWELAQNKDWKPAAEKWRDRYHEIPT